LTFGEKYDIIFRAHRPDFVGKRKGSADFARRAKDKGKERNTSLVEIGLMGSIL
jgi:hypothetical protein